MIVSITHKPSGRTIRFDRPSQAARWLMTYKENKLPEDELEIISPIHLSVYTQNIPDWAAELFARVELDYGTPDNRIVPRIHWMDKPKRYSTGTTYHHRITGETTHIAISCGRDITDAKGVVLHELAHAICPYGEHHGREFYRTLFTLLRQYLTASEEKIVVGREATYMKYSRYWYAEMWNITEVLNQYRTYVAPAPKKTAAQKTAETLNSIFEGM